MSDNALHTAAKAGDVDEVQSQVGNFDINAKGEDDETALFKAAESGHTEVVKLLATHNADVNLANVRIPTNDFDPSDMNFTIPYIYTASSFTPIGIFIGITHSRCTTFTFNK
jgi:ankyrin repeat protein